MTANGKLPVILPSEIWAREFDAKLLLACCLAERGYPVIVGCKNTIHRNIASLPRGLYIAKDFRVSSDLMYNILDRLGYTIMAWDEEATLPFDRIEYQTIRVSMPSFSKVAQFFAWGSDNQIAIQTVPGHNGGNVHLTGNPRGDLMRPELRAFFAPEVEDIRRRFGRFILINSNFGRLNHFKQSYKLLPGEVDPALRGRPNSPLYEKKGEHKYRMFGHFLDTVPKLAAAFPDRKIVIRPHPSENSGAWQDAAGDNGNVEVIHEGHVYPWLYACDVLVHSGCTTGMESYLLGVPVVGYQPIETEESRANLPNRLSHNVHSFDELVTAINGFASGELHPRRSADLDALVEPIITSLDGPLASDRIAELVDRYLSNPANRREDDWVRSATGWVIANARATKKRIDYLNPYNKCDIAFDRHRFPLLSVDSVADRLQRFNAILGRFKGVHAEAQAENIFRIAPAG